jgi:hypothetical protein
MNSIHLPLKPVCDKFCILEEERVGFILDTHLLDLPLMKSVHLPIMLVSDKFCILEEERVGFILYTRLLDLPPNEWCTLTSKAWF